MLCSQDSFLHSFRLGQIKLKVWTIMLHLWPICHNMFVRWEHKATLRTVQCTTLGSYMRMLLTSNFDFDFDLIWPYSPYVLLVQWVSSVAVRMCYTLIRCSNLQWQEAAARYISSCRLCGEELQVEWDYSRAQRCILPKQRDCKLFEIAPILPQIRHRLSDLRVWNSFGLQNHGKGKTW